MENITWTIMSNDVIKLATHVLSAFSAQITSEEMGREFR